MNLKDLYSRYSRTMWLFLTAWVCMLIIWYKMESDMDIAFPSMIGTLLKGAGDTIFILWPYWLLKPRWRWTIVIPVWIYAIWAVSNVMYFRFFGRLIPATALDMTDNVNSDLIVYIWSALKVNYLLYLLAPIIVSIAAYLLKARENGNLAIKLKLIAIVASLGVFAIGQLSYIKTKISWMHVSVVEGIKIHYLLNAGGPLRDFMNNGLVYYSLLQPVIMLEDYKSELNINEEEKFNIKKFIDTNINKIDTDSSVIKDSVNVVYIVVESLNADVLNRQINGLTITPTLDSLATLPGTVIIDNVIPQVDMGSSSDGRLILITGLLPTRSINYCFRYGGKNVFKTLMDALPGYKRITFMPEKATFWNKISILKNWGFGDNIYKLDSMPVDIEPAWLDRRMFRCASYKLKEEKSPYFALLFTLSSHWPFDDCNDIMMPQLENDRSLHSSKRDYLNSIHHFDKALREFLNTLPSNTMVFIASDHTIDFDNDGSNVRKPGVFMAINTPRTERISRTVSQAALFPTALELMGVSIEGYHGVLPSIFNDGGVDGTVDAHGVVRGSPTDEMIRKVNRAFEVSDTIIRSNYWGTGEYDKRK